VIDQLVKSIAHLRGSNADDLREKGWLVAVHNDYVQNDIRMTFWLLTHSPTGRFVRGEGCTDEDALDLCRAQIEVIEEGRVT